MTATFNILNVEPDQYSAEARSILHTLGILVEMNMARGELLARIHEFDVLIVRLRHRVDCELMTAAPRLKFIVSATTGLDHIDLGYAAQKGITVLSLRGEVEFLRSIPATAELTWGLLLALLRHIPSAHGSVLGGNWLRDDYKGHDLKAKRLGVVGLGRIGEKIAAYGNVFGMSVGFYDPFRTYWLPNVHKYQTLEDLLQNSDILSVHVPLNPETEKMIGANEFSCLHRGAYLINTSRGGVLDEDALLAALQNGQLAGAALDVLSNEQQFAQGAPNLLVEYARSHTNLIITPHIGGATYESMHITELFMVHKLAACLKKGTITS
ncbi:MAG: hydroxyacid dehydrogenase [Anaerolineales bacterium]|nr:hydroxyacid dehydrogenase [Anaerolineales bacterium]